MADPNVTADEAEYIRQAFEDAEASGTVDLADSITVEGTKEAFCDSWPTVKEVLAFLKDFAPPGISQAIAIVIRAGDAIHRRICAG